MKMFSFLTDALMSFQLFIIIGNLRGESNKNAS